MVVHTFVLTICTTNKVFFLKLSQNVCIITDKFENTHILFFMM